MILALRQHRLVAAAAITLFAALPHSSVLAQAADPPSSPHEAAVLDRIFANWKARHDRIQTFHFTWDHRLTCKQGTEDYSSTQRPRPRLERDQVFEQLGVQLWIEGDNRMCVVHTPCCKVPLRKPTDRGRVVHREVVVGNTTSSYSAGPFWEDGISPPRAVPRYGSYFRTPNASYPIDGLSVLLLAFRPRNPLVGCRGEDFSVVHGDAVIDGMHCTQLHRSVKRQEVGGGGWVVPHDETLWVSPARNDLVVRWTTQLPKTPLQIGAVKYKKDATYGWIPSEWSCTGVDAQSDLNEYKVTSYSINERIDPDIFSQQFPVGTPVTDQMKGNSAKDARYYVVENGGSQRAISPQDYFRLSGLAEVFGAEAAAARRAK